MSSPELFPLPLSVDALLTGLQLWLYVRVRRFRDVAGYRLSDGVPSAQEELYETPRLAVTAALEGIAKFVTETRCDWDAAEARAAAAPPVTPGVTGGGRKA